MHVAVFNSALSQDADVGADTVVRHSCPRSLSVIEADETGREFQRENALRTLALVSNGVMGLHPMSRNVTPAVAGAQCRRSA